MNCNQIKKKSWIVFFLVLVLAISGCSTGEESSQEESAQETSSSEAGTQEESNEEVNEDGDKEEEAETRTIETSMGDVQVPLNPQRVISTYGMGDVIALGVTLAATYDAEGRAYEDEVEGLPIWDSFEAEEIMSYDPDLILVINEDQYNELSSIAPTVLVPFTEMSMEERVTFLGQVLNKEEEAQELLDEFEEKIEEAKAVFEEKNITDATFSIFEKGKNGIWVYGDKWGRGGDLLYSHLGVSAPQVIEDNIIGGDQYREISFEVMNEYAGDFIVFSGDIGDLEDSPVWNSIPAVSEGRVIHIDFDLFYDIDIYSSSVQLEYLMEEIEKITA